jgi:hypothetical protein
VATVPQVSGGVLAILRKFAGSKSQRLATIPRYGCGQPVTHSRQSRAQHRPESLSSDRLEWGATGPSEGTKVLSANDPMNESRNEGRAGRVGPVRRDPMGRADVTIERRHDLPTLHRCYAPLRMGASVERHIFCVSWRIRRRGPEGG